MPRLTLPLLLALAAVAGCGLETRANPNYHAPKKPAAHGGTGGHAGTGGNTGSAGKHADASTDAGGSGNDARAGAGSAGAAGRGITAGGTSGSAGGTGGNTRACDDICSAPLPACDESAQRCVECLKREDCPDADHPVCEPATQTCVQCVRPDDCGGSTAVCDPQTHTCVQCLGSGDCGGDQSVCDPDTHACVECLRQSDCSDPHKALCNEKACIPCTGDTQCTRLAATPVCDRDHGTCVECTADTEAERCGTKACKRSTGTCTAVDRGTRTPCSSCEADSECLNGARCVVHDFGLQSLGPYCLYDHALYNSCANAANAPLRPYSLAVLLTSIDGAMATYCLPPPSTTCDGIADAIKASAGSETCTSADDCGTSGVTDGICGDSGTTMGKCTYGCEHDYDCPPNGFTVCNKVGTARCE